MYTGLKLSKELGGKSSMLLVSLGVVVMDKNEIMQPACREERKLN